jgi:hypothetical protein
MSRKVTYPKAGEIWSLTLKENTQFYLFLEQIPENPRHLKAMHLLSGVIREIVVWSEDVTNGSWVKV